MLKEGLSLWAKLWVASVSHMMASDGRMEGQKPLAFSDENDKIICLLVQKKRIPLFPFFLETDIEVSSLYGRTQWCAPMFNPLQSLDHSQHIYVILITSNYSHVTHVLMMMPQKKVDAV